MSINKEIERTYLAKSIPANLTRSKSSKIADIYFPAEQLHAFLRIRKYDDRNELTKKTFSDSNGIKLEENITLNAVEYDALAKGDGRTLEKTRYYYDYNGHIAEVDVFEPPLEGLILVDVEFADLQSFKMFEIPNFCLADVTQEEFIAGGVLSGKTFDQIAHYLEKFNYQRLFLKP